MKSKLLVSFIFKVTNQPFLFSGLQRGWGGRRPVAPISCTVQGAALPVLSLSLPFFKGLHTKPAAALFFLLPPVPRSLEIILHLKNKG